MMPTDLADLICERIVAAAVRLDRDGFTYSLLPPARHGDVLRLVHSIYDKDDPDFLVQPDEQGFVTSHHRFVDRQEGKVVARQAGQLLGRASLSKDLFSEDVW